MCLVSLELMQLQRCSRQTAVGGFNGEKMEEEEGAE